MTYIMETFNLNIDTYRDNELEDLMGLTVPYSHKDVTDSKEILLRQLTKDVDLAPEKNRELSFFIDSIASRLDNGDQKHYKLSDNPRQRPHDDDKGTFAEKKVPIAQYGSNIIIKNSNEIVGRGAKITQGRIAMSGKVPPGYINPINVRTTARAINIDSRFRPNYYKTSSSKFSMYLPAIEKRVVKMTVGALEIPLTYHAVSENLGNNKCLIIDNCSNFYPDPSGWLVKLPDGNYGTNELKGGPGSQPSTEMDIDIAMNNAIATADAGTVNINTGDFTPTVLGAKLDPTQDICYKWDRISGRSTFACPTGEGGIPVVASSCVDYIVRFTIDKKGNLDMNDSIQFKLGWPLGFRAGEYMTSGAAVSEGICFITGPRYGFLAIDDYQKNRGKAHMIAFTNSSLDENIMVRLNLAAVQDKAGVYKSANDPGLTTTMNTSRDYFGPVDIQKLTVALYDEYGRVIDINNMDWSFTLTFERLYD
jgi:hypothetical protein